MKSASLEHQRAPYVNELEDRRLGQGRPCSTAEAVRVRQLQKVTLYRETKEKKTHRKARENKSIDIGTSWLEDRKMLRASPIKIYTSLSEDQVDRHFVLK